MVNVMKMRKLHIEIGNIKERLEYLKRLEEKKVKHVIVKLLETLYIIYTVWIVYNTFIVVLMTLCLWYQFFVCLYVLALMYAGGAYIFIYVKSIMQEAMKEMVRKWRRNAAIGGVNLQNPSRPNGEQMHQLHDWLLMFIASISYGVCCWITMALYGLLTNRRLYERQYVEVLWTIIPCLILFIIAIPSLRLLYIVDSRNAAVAVKAIGRQWYWEYEYPNSDTFNSYIVSGDYRYLDVDNRLEIPLDHEVQMLITAADVLHSWTLPTMAVKADAVPGRINKIRIVAKRTGLYFGQCREICGRNHRFMPIAMECFAFSASQYFESTTTYH